MTGYKVFNRDWICRDKQYTCPGYFEEDVKPYTCKAGMHFCQRLIDCFNYYGFDSDNHVAEVEAVGDVDISDETKFCTNKLMIIREIPWDEVLRLVNTGKNCTGKANTGDCNTGDCNTGNRNTGNRNTGDFNTGDWNTGDWNFTNSSTGCFCTEEQHIKMFDKETNWTIDDWYRSNGYDTMSNCPKKTEVVEWIEEERMSEQEKEDNPTYKTTGGYLRVTEEYSDRQAWWDDLDDTSKYDVYNLPNFDAEKFYKCTGIRVDGK